MPLFCLNYGPVTQNGSEPGLTCFALAYIESTSKKKSEDIEP